jgi:SAM-dependent methyltransferase
VTDAVSTLFARHLETLRAPEHQPVLDLAAGRGRHSRPLAKARVLVLALDRNAAHLRELGQLPHGGGVARVRCNLESGSGICLADASCGAILVFRYLHRPLCAEIERVLRPGGLLLYETFTTAQRAFDSGPRNPDFLLEPGELPGLFPGLRAIDYAEKIDPAGKTALASLAAEKPRPIHA